MYMVYHKALFIIGFAHVHIAYVREMKYGTRFRKTAVQAFFHQEIYYIH